MATYASWSPGIAFMPAERPWDTYDVNNIGWTGVVGLRQSGGATFRGKGGTGNWFHVPIATPVIINDTRVKLQRVWVMFLCGDPAATTADTALTNLTDIHVWDGPNRIKTFGGFKLFGEHRFRLDDTNVHHDFTAPFPDIFFGVSIAVHINFLQDSNVTFASAGADFSIG